MGKNGHYTLESAWEEICKVKHTYNREKLIEIYHLVSPFINKYQDASLVDLTTSQFANDYLPILKKIVKQSAGKKLMLSFVGNPYVGITKSVNWIIWLPTRIGSQAAMSLLRSYIEELEAQTSQTNRHVSTQTNFTEIGDAIPDENPVLVPPNGQIEDKNDSVLVSTASTSPVLVPNDKNDLVPSIQNESSVTSGVGCDPCDVTGDDGFSASDGEMDEIMAECLNNSKVADETPEKPQLNSTFPTATPTASAPDASAPSRPSGPRKLTKGSRRKSFRDSGINLTTAGAWEDSRRAAAAQEDPDLCIIEKEDIKEIELSELEISQFENGDDVFDENDENEAEEDSSDSFIEIPDLE